jgi:hypothetical protein
MGDRPRVPDGPSGFVGPFVWEAEVRGAGPRRPGAWPARAAPSRARKTNPALWSQAFWGAREQRAFSMARQSGLRATTQASPQVGDGTNGFSRVERGL